MSPSYTQDQTFEKLDTLTIGEYESCVFIQCDWANGDLSGCKFIDCTFKGCNLNLTKLNKVIFREVSFKDCKMLGIRFDTCHEFGLSFSFDNCQLNHSSFYGTSIKKTIFKSCQLQEVDFVEADLSGASFDHSDLSNAAFDRTNLEKADFRSAIHYSLDPENNRIKKAKFSVDGLPGLMGKYDIEIVKE